MAKIPSGPIQDTLAAASTPSEKPKRLHQDLLPAKNVTWTAGISARRCLSTKRSKYASQIQKPY